MEWKNDLSVEEIEKLSDEEQFRYWAERGLADEYIFSKCDHRNKISVDLGEGKIYWDCPDCGCSQVD